MTGKMAKIILEKWLRSSVHPFCGVAVGYLAALFPHFYSFNKNFDQEVQEICKTKIINR